MSVGSQLDRNEYEKCKGSSTKLHKVIKKLSPDYNKLAQFAEAITVADPDCPTLVTWDHGVLLKLWGATSNYLHWAGEPAETVESDSWFNSGMKAVEEAANYVWQKAIHGYSGIVMPHDMQPEILLLWESFKAGRMDYEGVRKAAKLALPVLKERAKA